MNLKKVLLISVPLIAIGCAAAGLVLTGIVKVPFFPNKKPNQGVVAKAAKTDSKSKPKPKPTSPRAVPPVVAKKPAPTSDPEKGARKIAMLWNEMDSAKLQELTEDWKEPELARVLAVMETDKVAELLASLPPKRASAITRAIQREAARLPVPTTGT